ncbi:hypothetical protein ACSVDA_14425 [Cytobacillus sp. Hm23]
MPANPINYEKSIFDKPVKELANTNSRDARITANGLNIPHINAVQFVG